MRFALTAIADPRLLVEELPEKPRRAFFMAKVHGLSYREIAQLREMNAALEGNRTVRRRWRRNALAVLLLLAPLLVLQLPWQAWTADHRMAYHEVGEITLADAHRRIGRWWWSATVSGCRRIMMC